MSLDELARKLERGGSQAAQDTGIERAALEFFNDKNLDLKTELRDPLAMATLETLVKFVENEFGEEFSTYLTHSIKRLKINMIPFNRKSRSEVQAILQQAKHDEQERGRSILERLTSGQY